MVCAYVMMFCSHGLRTPGWNGRPEEDLLKRRYYLVSMKHIPWSLKRSWGVLAAESPRNVRIIHPAIPYKVPGKTFEPLFHWCLAQCDEARYCLNGGFGEMDKCGFTTLIPNPMLANNSYIPQKFRVESSQLPTHPCPKNARPKNAHLRNTRRPSRRNIAFTRRAQVFLFLEAAPIGGAPSCV